MKLNSKHSLFFLLIFFINCNLFAQLSSVEVDELITTAMEKFKVAGSAIAIVKDGKIIYEKGFGVKSFGTKEKVDTHTNFAIASNSKAFTTTALAMLVEEGKINWTDKVVNHIPEFKMYNAYVTENFNIQDLLTHRSGLGLGIGDLMWIPDGANFTIDDLLGSFQYFKPESAFRTKFDYDNLLYVVAGELIARKSGMSWEDFITSRIFKPLQMDHSYAGIDRMKDRTNLASPHNADTGTFKVLPHYEGMINGAAAGIYSNVDDLSKWMLVQLNNGAYGEHLKDTLFKASSQNDMWKLHTILDSYREDRYNSHFAGYGLGWFLKDQKGFLNVSHTGGMPGMLSKTVLIPDLNLGVIVLTNTEPGGGAFFSAVSNSIVDGYLGLDDFNWINKYEANLKSVRSEGDDVTKKVWETVEANKKVKINESNFIGVYKDDWFGTMEIFKKGTQLWIKSARSPKLNGPMYFYNANTFAIKWEYQDMNADAFAMFGLDENGKAQTIKMKGISPNIDFSFDFHDLDLKRVKMDD